MTELDLTKAIVWTELGNINEDQCEVYIGFQKSEDDSSVVFVKEHRLKDGGRQIRREAHVCILKGLQIEATIAQATEEKANG
jgi:hypothetical protein